MATTCNCEACSVFCRHIPGNLIPEDLEVMQARLGMEAPEFEKWCETKLLASPGAIAAKDGQQFRIPTIVPDRKADGSCIFLNDDGSCGIHKMAPFGCRFVDQHQDPATQDRRVRYAMEQCFVSAYVNEDAYNRLWHNLRAIDRMAPGPEVLRERMAKATNGEIT